MPRRGTVTVPLGHHFVILSEKPAMCPDLEDLHTQFAAADRDATALIQSLSPRQAGWASSPRRWSVLQCLEHISISVRLYLERINTAIERGWKQGMTSAGPYRYRRSERWVIRSLEPPYRFKAKTVAPYQPAGGRPPTEVLADFIRAHDELRDAMRHSDGLDLSGIRFRHPHAFFLVFSLGGSFFVLAGHARRHLWQARQVTLLPEFPKTEVHTASGRKS